MVDSLRGGPADFAFTAFARLLLIQRFVNNWYNPVFECAVVIVCD
jgi:hypothetical protein